jgi:hypothetical protein
MIAEKVRVQYGYSHYNIDILEIDYTTSTRYPHGFIKIKTYDYRESTRKLMIKINTKGKHFSISRWQIYFDDSEGFKII